MWFAVGLEFVVCQAYALDGVEYLLWRGALDLHEVAQDLVECAGVVGVFVLCVGHGVSCVVISPTLSPAGAGVKRIALNKRTNDIKRNEQPAYEIESALL